MFSFAVTSFTHLLFSSIYFRSLFSFSSASFNLLDTYSATLVLLQISLFGVMAVEFSYMKYVLISIWVDGGVSISIWVGGSLDVVD